MSRPFPFKQDRTGPLTRWQADDFQRFMLRPVTVESFAAFGAYTALRYRESRGAFGVALPGSMRASLYWKWLDAALLLQWLADPPSNLDDRAGSEAQMRERLAHSLAQAETYHATRLVPLIDALPAPAAWTTAQMQDAEQHTSGSGVVRIFPGASLRPVAEGDTGPKGAA